VGVSALRPLAPPTPSGPPPSATLALGRPGVLEDVMRAAGLKPERSGGVDVPFEVDDRDTLERAFLMDAWFLGAIDHAGEADVRRAIAEAAAPFRRPDGSYRLENRFRYVVGVA
jgi:hypothetical protein